MGFEDLAYLFTSDNRNRGILRMNFDEAACLWKAVASTTGDILEVGRRHGGSTVLLLAASDSSRRVVSVDIDPAHNPLSDAYFSRADVAERVSLIVADSRSYRTGPVGLMFIDGDHSYEGVTADVEAHWAQLEIGGLAVFHDAVPNDGLAHVKAINHCPGVKEACDRLIRHKCGEPTGSAGSVLVLKKTGELPEGIFK